MNKIYLQALLCSTALSIVAPATAQEVGDAPDETRVEETIIVNASRRAMPAESLPNTVRLIDRDAISEQLLISTNIIETLGVKLPSFSPARQKLSGFGESFRGRSPLYLIDGVPQSNPLRNGSRDGFTFDPAIVERVEVLYGANAIQGVGATGGVINYVTLSPTDEDRWQFRLEAGISASGDFDGDGYSPRLAATVLRDFGSVDLVASVASEQRGAFYDANGLRIGVDGVQGDLQDSASINLFTKLGWDIDELTRLQLTVNHFELEGDGDYIAINGDRSIDLPTTSIRGDITGEAPTNTVSTVSLDFTRKNLLGGTFSAQGFYRDFEAVFGGGVFGTFQDTTIDPTGTLFDQSANNSDKYGLKLTYSNSNLGIEGMTMTGGFDFLHDLTFQELIQTGRNWVPEVEFESYAPFVQIDQELFDGRALISAGLRNEFATVSVEDYTTLAFYGPQQVVGGEPDFSELLINVGGRFDLSESLSVYGSFSEGFTMPDIGRVLRAINTPGVDVDNLLNVEPIIADNTELGLSLDHGPWNGNVSYFWSASDLGQRLSAGADGIFNVNRERTEINGFEVTLEYEASNGLAIGGNFASLEGEFDSDDDGEVDRDLSGINISPDRLNLYVSAQPSDRINLRAQLSNFFDREFNGGGATDFDGYMTVDLSAGFDLGEGFGRVDLGIQNALNEDYITYYSQAGTTRNNRFFAGRGRNMTLRWSATY